MATYSSIACAEEFGTRVEDYDDKLGLCTARVTLRCAYDLRHALVADVCGQRRAYPHPVSGKVPLACQAGIQCTQAKGTYSDQSIDSLEALVTITYSTAITDIMSDSFEPTSEFITLDHRWFRWGSGFSADVLREEEAPGIQKRGVNYCRHYYDVTGAVSTDFGSLVGSCNDAPFFSEILGMTFAPQTLLYISGAIGSKLDSSNSRKYDIDTKFMFQPLGWNKFFRTKTGVIESMYLANSPDPYEPYPPASFANILTSLGNQ